jgi:1-acyl-sn-glycerol-3-phosphate acyltransferase
MVLSAAQRPLTVSMGFLSLVGGWIACVLVLLFLVSTILVINVMQMLLLVVIPFSRKSFRSINRWFANLWWGWCVIAAEKVLGVVPEFTGDDVPAGENAIIFANHQQMPDILVIMMLGYRKGRLGDMKWFVKAAIKYVPGIGWGMQFLDCIFVKRDWLADKRSILATFERFLTNRIPIWLITFVEGTRITDAKLQKSQTYCQRKKWPHLDHVMYPRTRGFTAALEGLHGHLDAVYDVTIGYEGGVPTVVQIYRGLVKKVHIDVRRFPIASLPVAEAERAAWLQERFVRKDQKLETLFRTGAFPAHD